MIDGVLMVVVPLTDRFVTPDTAPPMTALPVTASELPSPASVPASVSLEPGAELVASVIVGPAPSVTLPSN